MDEIDEYVYRATITEALYQGEEIDEDWAKESGLRWPSVRRILREIKEPYADCKNWIGGQVDMDTKEHIVWCARLGEVVCDDVYCSFKE